MSRYVHTCYGIHMSGLSNRLHLLLDDDRRERLERASERTGAPVSELVRRAIDRVYPADLAEREDALQVFLSLDPMPVDDWETMKAEMRDSLSEPGE
jgi:predicted DNA-binding protein